jgi:hypothetical protein
MGPKLGHEADGTGTVARIPPQNHRQREGDPHTHVDSTDPFRLLHGTKCSPLFPYDWVGTGDLTIRARYTHCGPDNDQSEGERSLDVHG